MLSVINLDQDFLEPNNVLLLKTVFLRFSPALLVRENLLGHPGRRGGRLLLLEDRLEFYPQLYYHEA